MQLARNLKILSKYHLVQMSSSSLNPLLSRWETPYELPPFESVSSAHYQPAIQEGMTLHMSELSHIVDNADEPSFENTISAFDRAGRKLGDILNLFYNQCSSDCPPELQKVQLQLSAPLAEHKNNVNSFPGLFTRIDKIYESRSLMKMSPEQLRLTERIHLSFVRGGARFSAQDQEQYKIITMELAELMTEFSQNVLADESSFTLPLNTPEDLSGLPDDLISSSQQAASERNLPTGSHVITLSRSLVEPFLIYSDNRDLRKQAWSAWINRGMMDPSRDNTRIIRRILYLRREQARLHGYSSYADYSTEDSMARTTASVMDLLLKVT